jgi:hypothetical protein
LGVFYFTTTTVYNVAFFTREYAGINAGKVFYRVVDAI